MDALKITGLEKSFGDKKVLKGLDLTVPHGSIFGFIGKNGAGKTTTMKIVTGLLEADGGEALLYGEKVKYGKYLTQGTVGYLPDVPEFYTFMTAPEYLDFCGKISGMDNSRIRLRRDELLELVGLKDEKHRIKGFSRGMKQRLGIASALLSEPRLVICDEPTSALDPVGRKEILDILTKVKESATVLFSTHILSDVERICTDIGFLNDGKIQVSGSLAEIKRYRTSDEYIIETLTTEDTAKLVMAFSWLEKTGDTQIRLSNKEDYVFELVEYIGKNKLPIVKFERIEPTLESLFLEAVEK